MVNTFRPDSNFRSLIFFGNTLRVWPPGQVFLWVLKATASRLRLQIFSKTILGSIPRYHLAKGCPMLGIEGMKRGKSPGQDSLSIEHLCYVGPHLPRALVMLFDLCIGHSYLSADLIRTIVVPILKSQAVDASDKGNYRPISLATISCRKCWTMCFIDVCRDTYKWMMLNFDWIRYLVSEAHRSILHGLQNCLLPVFWTCRRHST